MSANNPSAAYSGAMPTPIVPSPAGVGASGRGLFVADIAVLFAPASRGSLDTGLLAAILPLSEARRNEIPAPPTVDSQNGASANRRPQWAYPAVGGFAEKIEGIGVARGLRRWKNA